MTNKTEGQTDSRRRSLTPAPRPRGRVAFIATAAAAGLVYLGMGLAMGEPWVGVGGLAVMLLYAVVLLSASGRSETADLLSSSGRDERHERIQQRAGWLTLNVVIVALLAVFVVAELTGHEEASATAAGLAAVGGLTFVAATAWYARRG